ncbi:MAG: tRNA (5-methylaminomethyl-2-thiouridine)(34)-methyltransferase MnmD [Bacteroidales bacterium]|nr:tRNA (5-methylaminomethyl-2-thiouridine)(34)-methyltransferase MnmD [Bacteroidales bacterium]
MPGEPFGLKREIRVTGDGSPTIYVPALNENYHSSHGAVQESLHVFIEAGLKQFSLPRLRIFEVGFGTGLNCLLTCIYGRGRKIQYHTIEPFPVDAGLLESLYYPNLCTPDISVIFNIMHKVQWEAEQEITEGFALLKSRCSLNDFIPSDVYNLVYFDAFAPEVQPELWTMEVFEKIYNMLAYNGVLVTYCAKGEVRRNLQACGFVTERLPGPPGKREMLRARKLGSENDL